MAGGTWRWEESHAGYPGVSPCLPTLASKPPSGPGWIREIKHDGFRTLVLRTGDRVRVLTRNGIDWTEWFPLIADAARALNVRSCLIDGEVIAARPVGDFDLLRRRKGHVTLIAFDLLQLDGDDVRREPIEARKKALQKLLRRTPIGLEYNEHIEHEDGPRVFEHASRLGFEGIVNKRKGSRYQSGRCHDWVKSKNPNAPAAIR